MSEYPTRNYHRKAFQGLNITEGYVKSSGVDPKLLELMRYRVSQINGCAFCLDMHSKEALDLGETELRLFSVAAWKECPFYADEERAVLEFAEILTNANQEDVDDEIYDALTLFFTKEQIARNHAGHCPDQCLEQDQ